MRKQPFKDFISGGASRVDKGHSEREIVHETLKPHREFVFHPEKGQGKRFFSVTSTKVIFFVFFLLLGSFLWYSSARSSVVVKISAISEKIDLNDAFVAVSEKDAINDSVVFKSMKIEESRSLPIVATETKNVSLKANGEIVVYNNYSESPQKLIAGTRFESPDGKIYKIDRAITVPGRKTVSGKLVPGSLTVTVYAAEAGKEYNIKATDFTLPGLKGSPRYNSVYGRSKGDISGGYVGQMKAVSPSDVSIAKKKLEDSLRSSLQEKISKQVPIDYVTYKDATFFSFEDNSSTIGSEWEGDSVYLKMKGISETFIFNGKELATVIAKKKLSQLKNYKVHSNDLGLLNFEMLLKDGIIPGSSKMFTFKLIGSTKIVWDLDTFSLKKDLLGIKKDSYQEIFKKYPTIEKAETVFSPSWSRSFPNNVDRINIELSEN